MGFLEAKMVLAPEAYDPKAVKVGLTSGTGVEIIWADGHESRYLFAWLRDACPCATCEEERGGSGRKPGEPVASAKAALPMFKAAMRPTKANAIGKYAIQFDWNDGHTSGIYSWQYLRDVCPCGDCGRAAVSD